MSSAATVTIPSSPDEAAQAFAADPGVTVIGGGTVVVPQNSLGWATVERALWLGKAGLDGIDETTEMVMIGGTTTLAACTTLGDPLGACAANIGDRELQAQATIGGNICLDLPFGDLRGPLLALDATVKSVGADGETSMPAAPFFADHAGRLVLEVSYEVPAAGAFIPLTRHHTVSLTAMAISAVRSSFGDIRVAATGAAPDARRLSAVEAALASGASVADASAEATQDADPYDDELASAAYRARVLPVLVRRAIEQLGA